MMAVAAMALMSACHEKKQAPENIVTVKTAVAALAGASAGQQNYPGTIEEESGTLLSFSTAGTIKTLAVAEGQQVRAGQLIGVVDATTSGNAAAMAHATTQQARQAFLHTEVTVKGLRSQATQHLAVKQHLQASLFGEDQHGLVQRLGRDVEGNKFLLNGAADLICGLHRHLRRQQGDNPDMNCKG